MYTVDDLAAMKDLNWRSRGAYASLDDLLELAAVSNLRYLLDRGHDPDVAQRAALVWDWQAWPGRGYREHYVPAGHQEPIPDEFDWLISCGYSDEVARKFLDKVDADHIARESARVEREAYERTWRYRARQAWREVTSRVRLAVSALRGEHECEEQW